MRLICVDLGKDERRVIRYANIAVLYGHHWSWSSTIHTWHVKTIVSLDISVLLWFFLYFIFDQYHNTMFFNIMSIRLQIYLSIDWMKNNIMDVYGFILPSLVSCGVASITCQPPYPAFKSGLAIQASFHTWKFHTESVSRSEGYEIELIMIVTFRLSCLDDFLHTYIDALLYIFQFRDWYH